MLHEQGPQINEGHSFIVEQLAAEYDRMGIVLYLTDSDWRPFLVKQKSYGDLGKEVEGGVWSLPAETSRFAYNGHRFIKEWEESVLHRVCIEEIGVPRNKMKLKFKGDLDQKFPFVYTAFDAHFNGFNPEETTNYQEVIVGEVSRVAKALATVLVYEIKNPDILLQCQDFRTDEVEGGRFFEPYDIRSGHFRLRTSPDIRAIDQAVFDRFTR